MPRSMGTTLGELYPRDLRRPTLTDGVPTVEQEAAQAVGF